MCMFIRIAKEFFCFFLTQELLPPRRDVQCVGLSTIQHLGYITVLFTSTNTHILGSVSHSHGGRKTREAKTSDQKATTALVYF